MPTFDDYHGVYFSIQAIRMYHPEILNEVEFLIVDNNPEGNHGKGVKHFTGFIPNIKYIPEDKWISSFVKNKIFEHASGEFVLCMDCHIFFEPGSLKKLINFYKQNPETKDLYQGPLVYDDLKGYSTHFDPVWRGQMHGIWGTNPKAREANAQPFEIEMQGMGIFSCKRDAWLGFNPLFRGFGGEEGYIHEKFRQNGRKCWCLPFLNWLHRFGRPDGVKYPLTLENKIRNYFIGHLELGLDIRPLIEHFKEWVKEDILIQTGEAVREELKNNNLLKNKCNYNTNECGHNSE